MCIAQILPIRNSEFSDELTDRNLSCGTHIVLIRKFIICFLENLAHSCTSPIEIEVVFGLQSCASYACLIYCKQPQLCARLIVNCI